MSRPREYVSRAERNAAFARRNPHRHTKAECPAYNRLAQFRKDAQTRRQSLQEAARAMTDAQHIAEYGQPARALYAQARSDPNRQQRMAQARARAVAVLDRVAAEEALHGNRRRLGCGKAVG